MSGGRLAALAALARAQEEVADAVFSEATVVVAESLRPLLVAVMAKEPGMRVLMVITPTGTEAERLSSELREYTSPGQIAYLPAWETLPFERVSPAVETMGERMRSIWRIQQRVSNAAGADDEAPLVVVAPMRAALQRIDLDALRQPILLEQGGVLDLEQFIVDLVDAGYRREYQVEHRGEFSVRGGIVDLFPSTHPTGVRLDCFGDTIDRLSEFDISDQRSTQALAHLEVFPCRELTVNARVMARAAELASSVGFAAGEFARVARGEAFDGIESFLPWLTTEEQLVTDLLDDRSRVVIAEPRRARDRARDLLDEEGALAEQLGSTWGVSTADLEKLFGEDSRLHAHFDRLLEKSAARSSSMLAVAEGPEIPLMHSTGWPVRAGDWGPLVERLGALVRSQCSVVVAAQQAESARRLHGLLSENGLELDAFDENLSDQVLSRPGVHIVVALLDQGFICEQARVAVLSEADLTGRKRPHRVPRAQARPVEGFFDDLAVGSYVVHHVHGVARYAGMVTRTIAGAERDYLLLEYRGDDRLYIPSDQIDALTPYSGGDRPTLSRLSGNEWQRQRARVRQAVREVAQELVVLYQRRLASIGHAFSPDTPWQRELEQSFPFPETPDQLRAINDVKADMERPMPMDRLVCGDVGFGKTEVALRAVFKAVQDNKQVAVLVPTTLLAQQHFQTFSERFAPYPVRVEMLSRFLSPAEVRSVLGGLKTGKVDVVIGTHRLLASDVSFSDLGLLVVDEEQRFGVGHKEEVKKIRVGVDVLTLTASPIPRTLEMGLTGIRDLSVIDTPPAARLPILTYVGELDERAISEAIRRELLREGQVFFVHNRVRDIESTAAQLRELVPDARIAVAHGQLDEGSLEKIVLEFSEGRYDVLVCTTIIESGIDMPTVNTLVVDRADRLGLGQLHQLRGRVGRAGQRAYAYLFHPRDVTLSEQAYERLRTIGEHTELGSGFKIAMRDLEIRGAGNLLGNDQSGHIAAVGYDLYVQMVAEAVAELKGEPVRVPAEIKLDLPVDAHLPSSYVQREDLRLEAYRRLAAISGADEVEDVAAEWLDRFGPLPPPAQTLIGVARLRAECVRLELREITAVIVRPGAGGGFRAGEAVVRISPLLLPTSAKIRLARLHPRALFKEDVGQLIVPLAKSESLADEVAALLADLVPRSSDE